MIRMNDDDVKGFAKTLAEKSQKLLKPVFEQVLKQYQTDADGKVVDTGFSTKENPKKMVLKNSHSPGDIVMMTAAIRDLHATYPGQYITDVESPAQEIFEGNPFVTHLERTDDVEIVTTHYPLIHDSNEGSYHFIHGYRDHLQTVIGRPIKQGRMKPDLYIRDEERGWIGAVEEVCGDDRQFWIVDAGYKNDFTAKAWSFKRYQEVVDYFEDRIQFVQIGHASHNHPHLRGVIDMVGCTDMRQLIRLVYHSIGVLTPVSLPMTLAAGVPMKYDFPKHRACVVLSGGREPVQWQMYPNHQFIHTCGTMDCCDNGGCWKSRVKPIGDGDDKDKNNLCLYPEEVDGQYLGACMANISVDDVVRAIKRYYEAPHSVLRYLSSDRKTIGIKYKDRKVGK